MNFSLYRLHSLAKAIFHSDRNRMNLFFLQQISVDLIDAESIMRKLCDKQYKT